MGIWTPNNTVCFMIKSFIWALRYTGIRFYIQFKTNWAFQADIILLTLVAVFQAFFALYLIAEITDRAFFDTLIFRIF